MADDRPALRPVTPVGVLAERLAGLLAEIEDGKPPGLDWSARLRDAVVLARGLEPYAAACTTPASSALRRLESRTLAADLDGDLDGDLEPEMLSGHVEGQLLRLLVRATGARRVLEIGTFTGYAALAMAEALPDDGELVALEIDAHVAALAQRSLDQSAGGQRVVVLVGPAERSLRRLADGPPFDLVFLDADKAGYAGYVDLLLDTGLLAPDGLLCVDNTLMQGEPWATDPQGRTANGTAIADFNLRLAEDPRVEQVLVPVRDGLTLVRRA